MLTTGSDETEGRSRNARLPLVVTALTWRIRGHRSGKLSAPRQQQVTMIRTSFPLPGARTRHPQQNILPFIVLDPHRLTAQFSDPTTVTRAMTMKNEAYMSR